jgi:hypothetical protein
MILLQVSTLASSLRELSSLPLSHDGISSMELGAAHPTRWWSEMHFKLAVNQPIGFGTTTNWETRRVTFCGMACFMSCDYGYCGWYCTVTTTATVVPTACLGCILWVNHPPTSEVISETLHHFLTLFRSHYGQSLLDILYKIHILSDILRLNNTGLSWF